MKALKRTTVIIVLAILAIYFVPLVVEGFKNSSEEMRQHLPEIRTVKVIDEYTTAYREYGPKNGYPVIMIHGFSHSMLCWHETVKPVADRGYRVYTIDLLGHGLSDKPYGIDYTIPLFTSQVYEFMKAKGIKKAVIMGHSMGGATAMRFSCEHPEMVKKLVLIGAAGAYRKESGRSILFTLMQIPIVGEFIMTMNFRAIVRESLQDLSVYEDTNISDQYMDRYILPSKTKGYDYAILNILRTNSIFKANINECMPKITAQTLIIHGTEDQLVPYRAAGIMDDEIPNSRLYTVQDGPHSPMESDPKEVNRVILGFL